MSGVKSVSRHDEASAGDGSFAQQGGLIAQQHKCRVNWCQTFGVEFDKSIHT